MIRSPSRVRLLAGLLMAVPFLSLRGQAPSSTVFRDVNLLPMTCECVLPHQTVVVTGGVISRVGPLAVVTVPQGARIVEGRGQAWLLPGLADMHVHSTDPADLPLYLANGVTTILNLGEGGAHDIGHLKDLLRQGLVDGPTLYAAFYLDGPGGGATIVSTDSAARAAVRYAKARGYEFIKAYNSLPAVAYRAILDEAPKLGLGVTGHAVRSIPLNEALSSGQSLVVHAEEYLYTVLRNTTSADEVEAAAGMTRRAGASLIPNMSAYEVIARQWGSPPVIDTLLAADYVKYLSPKVVDGWRGNDYITRGGTLAGKLAILGRLTRAMRDSGVRLMTGTDSPGIPGMAPGYALHEDLRTLTDAGITRWQVLTAATRNPGEYVHRFVKDQPVFGVVQEGARADLILAGANPAEGLNTLRRPLGVMARGRWYPESSLHVMLDSMARVVAEERAWMTEAGTLARAAGGATLAREIGARGFHSEYALNHVAYDLMNDKRPRDAVPLFELNSRLFPLSSNVWESLCEGYEAVADTVRARSSCKQALTLDAWNQDAQAVLARLAPH